MDSDKLGNKKIRNCIIAVAVILVIAVVVLFINSKRGLIDITHGGEKEWICDSESDWVFDYNWAEIDEDWKGFDENASLKMGADVLTGSSDLKDDIEYSIGRDYIEERLNPIHYSADSYFELCPKKSVKNAQKQWKKYLKDHKELKKMYIVVNGEKMFPYADDDFDKSYIINESTAFPEVYDDYGIFGSDDVAKRFCTSIYMVEDLDGLESMLRGCGFNNFADSIADARQTAQTEGASLSGCYYFYPEDSESDCNALLFMMNYLDGIIYEGEDGRITALESTDGNYLLGYSIEYN